MEDILLNKNTVKNVILQKKQNKTKKKRKSQVDLLWQFNAWLDLLQIFIFMI